MRISWYWPDGPGLLNGRFKVVVPQRTPDIWRITDMRYGYNVCRVDFLDASQPNPENFETYMETLLLGAEIYYQEHYGNDKTTV